jgi:hypothetical protein
MLTAGELDTVFQMYWDDMQRCRAGSAYWSLLHVTVCLPDICAALESERGRTAPALYIDWCDANLPDALLTGEERYMMRCKVLHEGRAHVGQSHLRYSGFAFTQPAANGDVDHRRVDGTTLVLEVGSLSAEYRNGVQRWIKEIEAQPTGPTATNVAANLQTIVRVRRKPMPVKIPGIVTYNNRSS